MSLEAKIVGLYLEINVLLGAEVTENGQAAEQLAEGAIEGEGVKHCKEDAEDRNGRDDGRHPLHPRPFGGVVLLVAVGELSQLGEDGVGQEQPGDEAEGVRVVVDPGHEAQQEEDAHHRQELPEGQPGAAEDLPGLHHLHHERRQHAEEGARGADLGTVRDEHGGGEVAKYTKAHFEELLLDVEEYKQSDFKEGLRKSFLKVDESLNSGGLEEVAKTKRDNPPSKSPLMKILTDVTKKKSAAESSAASTDSSEDQGEDGDDL